MKTMYDCDYCQQKNERLERIIESLKLELKRTEDQVELWKRICKQEIKRSWWDRLFNW